jgi:hypothetical protein
MSCQKKLADVPARADQRGVFSAGLPATKSATFCAPQRAAFDTEQPRSARRLIPVKAQNGCDIIFRGE